MESGGAGKHKWGSPSPAFPCPHPNSTCQSPATLPLLSLLLYSLSATSVLCFSEMHLHPSSSASTTCSDATATPGRRGSEPRQSRTVCLSDVAPANPALSVLSAQQSAQQGLLWHSQDQSLRPSSMWPSLHSYNFIS